MTPRVPNTERLRGLNRPYLLGILDSLGDERCGSGLWILGQWLGETRVVTVRLPRWALSRDDTDIYQPPAQTINSGPGPPNDLWDSSVSLISHLLLIAVPRLIIYC